MNKVDDLIKVLNFCKENEKFIRAIYEKTILSKESFDDLGVEIVLEIGTVFNIYNNCYEIDGVEFNYNNIEEVLNSIKECFEKSITINSTIISKKQLEEIYDFYARNTVAKDDIDKFYNIMEDDTIRKIYVDKFLKDIEEHKISIRIFKDFRDLMYDLYVDGLDDEQITDNVVNLAQYGFDVKKCNNILELNGMYILIDF